MSRNFLFLNPLSSSPEPPSVHRRYVINVKQIAKFVVNLGDNVSPMDIEEGMRVGVDRSGKYQVRKNQEKAFETPCALHCN